MTEMSAAQFRQVIDVDLNAPFIVAKMCIRDSVKAVQLGFFQNLGVQRRHAVGGVGEVDVYKRQRPEWPRRPAPSPGQCPRAPIPS